MLFNLLFTYASNRRMHMGGVSSKLIGTFTRGNNSRYSIPGTNIASPLSKQETCRTMSLRLVKNKFISVIKFYSLFFVGKLFFDES